MGIYGRFGQPVTITRLGTIEDVKQLDDRDPDAQDRKAVENGSYVVVNDDGVERLYHQAFLKADDGSREIGAAIRGVVQSELDEVMSWIAQGAINMAEGPCTFEPGCKVERAIERLCFLVQTEKVGVLP